MKSFQERRIAENKESKEVLKFLTGLDDAYAVVGQILLIDPLLVVTKAYSLIIQDEKQRAVSNQGSKPALTDVAAFAVKDHTHNSGRNFSPKNPYLKCDRCDAIRYYKENRMQFSFNSHSYFISTLASTP
ncbi:hypothetical protein L3X38_042424 [Prunus dulcis]|uniref:Uncharacterized protein n=1 Tax=Prunus dulcis TaxID=3755 RepID=A0AAD4UUV0_PRUDU|nr:hypothetical protein L3X38_042424 [Prunus dulcis]